MRLLLVISLVVTHAAGYSSGPPPTACSSMSPSHGNDAKRLDVTPFTITADRGRYTAGGTVKVTVTGTDGFGFMGFMLQARKIDTAGAYAVGEESYIGSFLSTEPNTKPGCDGKALTHSGPAKRTSLTATWTPPSSGQNDVQFIVTVVEVKAKIYEKRTSVTVSGPAGRIAAAKTTTANKQSFVVNTDECGKTKSCLLIPSNCAEEGGCDSIFSWTRVNNKDEVLIEMSFRHSSDRQWLGLGLSTDATMGDDSVMICGRATTGQVTAYNAYNDGRSSGAVSDNSILNPTVNSDNSRVRCRFTRTIASSKDKVFALSDNFVLIPAWGKMGAGATDHRQHSETPKIVDGRHSLAATSYYIVGASYPYNMLIKLHGVFMLLAWVFFASSGILLARYYKPMWPNSKPCGVNVWFAIHRPFMITVAVLTATAFIIILNSTSWKFYIVDDLPQRAHPILGLIVIIFCFINPIMSLFRCAPDAKYRPVFNWFHWAVGTIAHIFGIVNCFIGFTYAKATVPAWVSWVLVVWCIFQMACEIILELHGCIYYKKNKHKKEEFEMRKAATPQSDVNVPEHSGRRFKSIMLLIYFIISFILVLTIVIGILVRTGN